MYGPVCAVLFYLAQLKVQWYSPDSASVLTQLIYCSMSPRESAVKTASRSVQPFDTAHPMGQWTDRSMVFTRWRQSAPRSKYMVRTVGLT